MKLRKLFRRASPPTLAVQTTPEPAAAPEGLLHDQARILGGRANVIADVGAHAGASTSDYARLFADATIYAFEPEPANFAKLAAAIAPFGRRCEAVKAAVSDKAGTITLNINSHDGTHSLLENGATEFWAGSVSALGQAKVTSITLDRFARERGITEIDILKMDIQGAELLALKGAQGLLKAGRIKLLALEVEFQELYRDQPLFWDICAHLHGFGYAFHRLYDPVYHRANPNLLCWADAIFLSPGLTRLPD